MWMLMTPTMEVPPHLCALALAGTALLGKIHGPLKSRGPWVILQSCQSTCLFQPPTGFRTCGCERTRQVATEQKCFRAGKYCPIVCSKTDHTARSLPFPKASCSTDQSPIPHTTARKPCCPAEDSSPSKDTHQGQPEQSRAHRAEAG